MIPRPGDGSLASRAEPGHSAPGSACPRGRSAPCAGPPVIPRGPPPATRTSGRVGSTGTAPGSGRCSATARRPRQTSRWRTGRRRRAAFGSRVAGRGSVASSPGGTPCEARTGAAPRAALVNPVDFSLALLSSGDPPFAAIRSATVGHPCHGGPDRPGSRQMTQVMMATRANPSTTRTPRTPQVGYTLPRPSQRAPHNHPSDRSAIAFPGCRRSPDPAGHGAAPSARDRARA